MDSRIVSGTHPVLRAVVACLLVLAVGGAGALGFLIGQAKDAAALAETGAAAGAAYYESFISSDEALSQRIEKINVQERVTEQSKQIDQLQDEVDSAQKNILDALMRNMTSKLSSRSSSGYKAYIKDAKVLLSLNSKVVKFKKSEYVGTVDITTYEKAITSRLSRIPTLRPTSGTLEGYGWRIHPIFKYRQFHPALDIGGKRGQSIKATGAGTVVRAHYDSRSGNCVIIDHGNGFQTYYMHCQKMLVRVGQKVSKGQQIATMGSTGTSTSTHLHYEVHYHGSPFNPKEIILQ